MNQLAVAAFKLKGQAQHLISANSPAILAAIGVSGTISTAYLTGKASYDAALLIDEMERRWQTEMSPKEKAELVWNLYIPAAVSGGLTITAIIAATAVGNRRMAAIATAYSLSDKAFVEYKNKVSEKFGVGKEQKIRDEVAQDEVTRNPPSSREIIIAGPGNVLCYERFTGRYFHSDMETLRKAQNTINAKLNREMYSTLSDFYCLVGLSETSASQALGWDSDKLMELEYSTVLTEDSRPCLCIEYNYTKPL